MMTGDVAFWTYVSDVLWLDYFIGVEASEMNVSCACDGIQAEEMLYENQYDLFSVLISSQ